MQVHRKLLEKMICIVCPLPLSLSFQVYGDLTWYLSAFLQGLGSIGSQKEKWKMMGGAVHQKLKEKGKINLGIQFVKKAWLTLGPSLSFLLQLHLFLSCYNAIKFYICQRILKNEWNLDKF